MNADQIKNWRKAHPDLDASDEALAGMPDCATLYANDFLVALESQGNGAVPFLRALMRECVWAYGNWQKAQRDSDAPKLMADLLNNAQGGAEYETTRRFLRDYMRANNIPDLSRPTQPSSDFEDMLAKFDAGKAKPEGMKVRENA